MMFSRWLNICLGFGAVLILTFLFLKTQAIDFGEHDRFSTNLHQLKGVDALLNQDILRSRIGLLASYDPIVAEVAELKRISRQLKEVPAFVDARGRADLSRHLREFDAALKEKETLIDRFSSQNAVINNSLRYFPIAATELMSKTGTRPGGNQLALGIDDLLRDVLTYNLVASEDLVPRMREQLETLGSKRRRSTDLDTVITHARTILKVKPEIDALTRNISNVPTMKQAEQLNRSYNQHYESGLRRSNAYRLYLCVFSVILLGYRLHHF